MTPSIDVYVASHKPISYPLPEYCHRIQVNAAKQGRWDGWLHDDEGENISQKNAQYCELTALYSLWKNSDADIRGLFHYRRMIGEQNRLSLANECVRFTAAQALASKAIRRETILSELEGADVILPMPHCPYPTDALEDLQRFCYPGDILTLCRVIAERWPDYVPAFRATLSSLHLAYCNMFIARASFVNGYCSWLFSVLREVEEQVCLDGYDAGHQRIFGYLAEVLLNVYIRRHGLRCRYHYMLHLYEGRRYPAVVLRRAMNLLVSVSGAYPRIPNRPLWRERYRHLLALDTSGTEPEQVFPAEPEALRARMLQSGAATSKICGTKELPCVLSVFSYRNNNIAVATYLATQTQTEPLIREVLSESEKLRERLEPDVTLLVRIGFRDHLLAREGVPFDDRMFIRYVQLQ